MLNAVTDFAQTLHGIPALGAIGIATVCFFLLLVMGDIVDLAPSFLECFFHWKENVNLNNNNKMRTDRNVILMALIPADILVLTCYHFHPLTASENIAERFIYTVVIVMAYIGLRILCRVLFFRRHLHSFNFQSAVKTPNTAAITVSLAAILEFGVCRLIGVENSIVQQILQWTIVAGYTVAILKEFQVFMSYRGFLVSFLYLCALEFLPTGLLAATYYVL